MLKFFTDIHISPRAVAELRRLGVDIIRSLEANFPQTASDADLLAYAATEKRVMVTCDTDFITLHGVYLEENREHSGIVYLNMNTGECGNLGLIVQTLHFLAEAAVSEDDLKNNLWRANQ